MHDVIDVHTHLTEVVSREPDRRDPRSTRNLGLRYIDGGRPACLVAQILADLGVSLGVLRALDAESGRGGGGVRLQHSQHPIRRRFTGDAWSLLVLLQRMNDSGEDWKLSAELAVARFTQQTGIVLSADICWPCSMNKCHQCTGCQCTGPYHGR